MIVTVSKSTKEKQFVNFVFSIIEKHFKTAREVPCSNGEYTVGYWNKANIAIVPDKRNDNKYVLINIQNKKLFNRCVELAKELEFLKLNVEMIISFDDISRDMCKKCPNRLICATNEELCIFNAE